MDVPTFGTWEMLGNNAPLASIVTVVTQCWGLKAKHGYRVGQTWSDFQSLFDTLLLIFLLQQWLYLFLKEEFTLLSRAPNSLGSDILAGSSLCVFDLVDFPIKTYFISRYARYAIKSDYLNLMFELCLRFFYLTSYLKQKKIYVPFLFLNLEFFYF